MREPYREGTLTNTSLYSRDATLGTEIVVLTESTLIATFNPEDGRRPGPMGTAPVRRGRIGLIVAGSLAAGLLAAVLLVVARFGPGTESAVTGSVLCGFALGWAMLGVLSVRFTDQPQRWAFAPALLIGLSGLLLVMFGSPAQLVLNWVWPPAMLALAIWMIVRVHQRLRGWRTRWLLYPVIAMLALASIGGGYETIGEAADSQSHPMPGQLIDVGGHRLHLHCTGSGSPTVVLEAGGGGKSSDLGRIAPAVERDTRVCVYDRAGRGWSESAQTAPHGIQIATDLHTLLQRGHVPGPYVLAGHSFGGLYVQTFAARYPSEVAGMVLIDSTAPSAAAPDYAAHPYLLNRVFALVSASAQLGLGRLYGATARDLRSTIDEYADAGDSVKQAASLTDFGNKPLFVLTAGSGHDAASSKTQNEMAALSTNSVHRVVEGASHQALIAERDGVAATTQAIFDVVSCVRSSRPLVM
ncbi:alpha/beta fold hydrolase [Glaciibacter sp. 2TAF33]|uniref:alpha/beta fold hydrolase n=1 Tax=Glaciibacter sp. 2TAF33 TaxID=3233015 RepID=UPI003F906128